MPLTCAFAFSATAYQAGPAAPPTLSLTATNSGTAPVAITGLDVVFSDRSMDATRPASPEPLPMSQNQSATIAAGTSTTYGPFALAMWSSAPLNPAPMIPPDISPLGTYGFPLYEVFVGGVVYASDGSANIIARARILVALSNAPARAYLGGVADFSQAQDTPLTTAVL